jgi:hypothetical protein
MTDATPKPPSPDEQATQNEPKKQAASKTVRDWTPLGQVRDYFAEQIKHDGWR